ncbi:MAG: transcription termination factor Rho [Butyrivibrio sp.]|nr:transcription termination factor Rho [Butyrivibrio sp.]
MREKYESLTLADLKEIAKIRGIKGITGMKKAEIIDAMCALDEDAANNKEDQEKVKKTTGKRNTKKTDKEAENTENKENVSAVADKKESDNKVNESRETRTDIKANESRELKSDNKANENRESKSDSNKENREHKDESVKKNKKSMNKKVIITSDMSKKDMDREIVQENRRERDHELEETREPVDDIAVGEYANGILEVMQDGFGFIRCENYLPGENDVYVAPSLIRKFNLKTGDILKGVSKAKKESDKFAALLRLDSVNGYTPDVAARRSNFENMTPIFPNYKIRLESQGCPVSMRIMDMICPIGRGQRGMIVAPPKAGKTTLLKDIAKAVKQNSPDIHLIVLLIDERPEEVTDIKECIEGPNAEVIYSTFDELPEHHKRVAEMVMERAKRLVEHNKHVMILLDSITRLTRAYNIVVPPSGRTLSGGLDPAALHMPKKFFGAARNMREGGSLTILATALIETGSKMDDVIYEEFKGTGNMEIVLNRKLQEKRIFPAIDIPKSSTRREDLLLTVEELQVVNKLRKGFNGMKADDAVDTCINMFSKTRNNIEFVRMVEKQVF